VQRVEHLGRAVLEEDPPDTELVLALRHLAHLEHHLGEELRREHPHA
jgi:hypothetical protein